MTDYGKASIITPCHNGAETIGETIESVLGQSYANWEMIIVDDCSTDDSVSVVKAFADPRIRLLQNETNLGPGGTRNVWIRAASGRFLAFLDADDAWLPEKLAVQTSFMAEHDCAFSCHGYFVCDESLNALSEYMPPARVTYADVLTNNTIGCLSAMIDTEKVGKVCMPEGKYTREDMVTWLRVLKKCGECLSVPEKPGECLSVPEKRGECLSVGVVLAKYRTGAASVSSNKAKLLKYQYRMYRDDLGLSVPRSAWLTLQSVWNKLFRKY